MDRQQLNPVQRRVLEDLLAVDAGRPPVDEAIPARLGRLLHDRTAEAAALVPPDARGLVLSKGRLDALGCDGRFVDLLDTPFTWTPGVVVGSLAHAGIDVDLAGRRARDPDAVVDLAWERLATAGPGAGDYLAGLGGVEADSLRADALRMVLDFRDQFPLLPAAWVRAEPALRVRLHGGRIELLGKPDLMIGRPVRTQRRMVLIDLKTRGRHPLRHRADMRLYALLATLKYGIAPFRVATYYLDAADWDVEDVDADMLEAAARDVASKVPRAVRLAFARPPEDAWQLVPGPACGWCGRAEYCPAKAAADADAVLAEHS